MKTVSPARADEVVAHWAALIDRLQFSSQEFYARVELALGDRLPPGLEVCRVLAREGGPLSPRREYLRAARERLFFDVCAAPFGRGFFVSSRLVREPLRLWLITKILLFLTAVLAVHWATNPLDALVWQFERRLTWGLATLGATAGLAFLSLVVWFGMNLDAALMRIPLVGYLYQRYLRAVTYYRTDLECIFQQAVHAAVMEVLDAVAKAQGIPPLSELERRPVFHELFRPGGTNGEW